MIPRFYFTPLRNRSLSVSLQLSVVILFLYITVVPSAVAQSEIHYSDEWVDDSIEDELQAVGVGVTEADYQTEADGYTVEARLQSPSGQTASITVNGVASVTAEVAMTWNLDWGNWLITSFHRGVYTQCFWDDFYGDYRCHTARVLLASGL